MCGGGFSISYNKSRVRLKHLNVYSRVSTLNSENKVQSLAGDVCVL